MFCLTSGYLRKIFQCKSLTDETAQNKTSEVQDKSLMRLYESKLPVFKITEVMSTNSPTLVKMVTTDSDSEAFIWIDSEIFHEKQEKFENGTVMIVNSFSLMDIFTATQIYGGQYNDYVYKSAMAIDKVEVCCFLRDYQIVGREIKLVDKACNKLNICEDYGSITYTIGNLISNLKRDKWCTTALIAKTTELKQFTSKRGELCCYRRYQLTDKTGMAKPNPYI